MGKAEGFIEITPIGWDELSKQLGDPALVRSALNSGLKKVGKEILVPAVKSESPRGATGNLKTKTVGQVLGRDEDMRLEIRQSAFNKQFPYGVAVRMGTRPHFPPYRELIPWVSAKLHPEKPERVAFLVARKISKVGTKANPYHEKVMEAHGAEVQSVMEEQVKKVVDEKVKGV